MAVIAALAVAGALILLGGRRLGGWLVVSDPLQPASAILVLSGGLPFRAMEAAKLYREGWAPAVWVTHVEYAEEEGIMKRLGLEWPSEDTSSVQVLEKLGVPPGSILILPEGIVDTAGEERAALDQLRKVTGERVIIVTSPPHTRRARAIWRAVAGNSAEAIVRPAPEAPFDAARWWHTTRDIQAVSHECLGLINLWLRFLAPPGRR